MNERIYTIILLTMLAGCDTNDDAHDELSSEPEPSTAAGQDIEAGNHAEPYLNIAGLDAECVAIGAPIIAKVYNDPLDCEFDEFGEAGVGWTAERLIDSSPGMLAAMSDQPLSGMSPLRHYCKYEYAGLRPFDDAYTDFMDAVGLSQEVERQTVATDCPVVRPFGDGLASDDALAALHDAMRANVGAIDSADLIGVSLEPTHVFLLDTGTGDGSAYAAHGDLLANVARELSCVDGRVGCEAQFEQVLALPRRKSDLYRQAWWADGGELGHSHETALAIIESVLRCLELNDDGDAETHERCVVTLPVGAEPDRLYATNLSYAPAQSVYEALRMAHCYGIPVFASAGNYDIDHEFCPSQPDGLAFPANLDEVAGPSVAQCTAWGYVPDWDTVDFPGFTNLNWAPGLVTAVGGVGPRDEDIDNQRPDSKTRLQALGTGVVSSEDDTPLQGTSGPAVLAAVAAHLAWSVNPNLSGTLLLNTIYATGYGLGDLAQVGRFAGQQQRRVSLCATLDQAGALGLGCPASAPAPDGNLGDFATATADAVQYVDGQGRLLEVLLEDDAAALNCAQAEPWPFMLPQPFKPKCSICSATGGTGGALDTAYLEITTDDAPVATSVTHGWLYLYNAVGDLTSIAIPQATIDQVNLYPTHVIELAFEPTNAVSGSIKFKYSNGTSMLEPLIIY